MVTRRRVEGEGFFFEEYLLNYNHPGLIDKFILLPSDRKSAEEFMTLALSMESGGTVKSESINVLPKYVQGRPENEAKGLHVEIKPVCLTHARQTPFAHEAGAMRALEEVEKNGIIDLSMNPRIGQPRATLCPSQMVQWSLPLTFLG